MGTWFHRGSAPKRARVSSGIAGRGLFATERIGAGEIVAVKGGRIVSTSQLMTYPIRYRTRRFRSPTGCIWSRVAGEYEPVMLFINHSCEPNVGFAGNIVLVAMRDVRSARNSPPTTRYSTTTTDK